MCMWIASKRKREQLGTDQLETRAKHKLLNDKVESALNTLVPFKHIQAVWNNMIFGLFMTRPRYVYINVHVY